MKNGWRRFGRSMVAICAPCLVALAWGDPQPVIPAQPTAVPEAAATAPAVPSGPAPVLTVEKNDLDLGTVLEGKEAVATFRLKNTGTAELKILRASPS